jgi:integrase
VLEYVPKKTKDESAGAKVRVPLTETAAALMQKYEGKDKDGHLFPCISAQKYNDAIKEIFKESGIIRRVQVRNAKSGETESKPLYEVASSHLARRTFIGNMYRKVKDPNIIGKMSGHAEGSKAFARYRDIDDTILDEAITAIE